VDLDTAIREFDAVEANLRRLERVWERLEQLTPDGLVFLAGSAEGREHHDLRRAYADLVAGLPAIDGWRIDVFPMPLDELAQDRLDARDIGVFEAIASVERTAAAPGDAIGEYRYRFNKIKRAVVRERAQQLMDTIETKLRHLVAHVERNSEEVIDPDWPRVGESIAELQRLLGNSLSRTGRWSDLMRHLSFGQGFDVHDIHDHDWPSVKVDIHAALYDELEPLPTAIADLGDIAAAKPSGPVSTKLPWDELDAEGFERLVFNLISGADGYENPEWLMQTSAPDRGRDLSVIRILSDSLSGVARQRIVIQCKHWLSRSIGPAEVHATVATVRLWEPPPDILIIATSGRFTANGVASIEKHNAAREWPQIEMWPESHLELLLAARPEVLTELGLRLH
jgi:hypothetical protein